MCVLLCRKHKRKLVVHVGKPDRRTPMKVLVKSFNSRTINTCNYEQCMVINTVEGDRHYENVDDELITDCEEMVEEEYE